MISAGPVLPKETTRKAVGRAKAVEEGVQVEKFYERKVEQLPRVTLCWNHRFLSIKKAHSGMTVSPPDVFYGWRLREQHATPLLYVTSRPHHGISELQTRKWLGMDVEMTCPGGLADLCQMGRPHYFA